MAIRNEPAAIAALHPPGRRRIPAQMWDAAVEARRVQAEASAAAAATLERAESEAGAVLQRAAAAGREEGLASVTEMLARAEVRHDGALVEGERELVELAFAVAASVVGEIAARHRELVVDTAARALAAARQRVDLALRAHPEDVAALREAEPRLLEAMVRARRIVLVPDSAVTRGGVVLETEAGTVDARLETQLGAVRRALLGERP